MSLNKIPYSFGRNKLLYLFKCLLICFVWCEINGDIIEVVEKVSAEMKEDYIVISETDLVLNPKRGKLDKDDLYMAQCSVDDNCNAAYRLICKSGHCVCKPGDLFFDWPKYGCFSKVHMFGPCEVSGQCLAYTPNTYCNPDNSRCTCSPNYFFNGRDCILRYDPSNLKAQEVYKAAVVAAACFIVAVVGIFVACIVRRSFCRREQNLPQNESNRNSDIFSISDEIAAMRAVDKPPSYEEVLQIERTFYGIPPPEYSASRNVNNPTYQSGSHFPTCQRILPLPYLSDCIPRPNVEAGNLASTSADKEQTDPNLSCPETSSSSNMVAAVEVISPANSLPPENPISDNMSSTCVLSNQISSWGESQFASSTSQPYLCEECAKTTTANADCDKCKANLEKKTLGICTNSDDAVGVVLPSQITCEEGVLNSSLSTCMQSSPIRLGQLTSFTPPPNPRRERAQRPTHASSLPGSPFLSSHSSDTVLNLPLLKELLKSDSQRFEQSIPSTSQNDNSSHHSDSSSDVPTLAYDNLGFVPDSHV
ncbi:uncharacterized protein [Parasteatoda tepidariorum]|uniref:uncharacterized protein isoform X2 n=1 Tax=Parasteatoda tepidariorum TaxID=114398 RepID=UPI001C723BE1|nr:uncharacterized protein LOC107453332 isoform X2 [Parasteatoda tepidariorum]